MELRRVLTHKAFLACLLVLVVLNCFTFLYGQIQEREDLRAYANAYHQQIEELSGKSWDEGLAWCQNYQAAYQRQLQWRQPDPELARKAQILGQIEAQYTHLLDYDDYLARIDASVARLQGVSLFSQPDSYSGKNLKKTARDFGRLRGVELSMGHDLAVTEFFRDPWVDYSVLILMGVVCGLFAAERREGLWPMIHCAPGGRCLLALKRIGVLLLAACLGTVLIAGSKILLCAGVYHGLDEWDRAVQSIPMFANVPISMTLGEFWLMYLLVKALGAFLIGLVLYTVLSAISHLGLALAAAGLLVGVEFAFTAIPSGSVFAPLRYVNILSYVDFTAVFTRYLNLSIFGELISGSDLVLAMLLPLCLLFSLGILGLAQWKYPVSGVHPLVGFWDGVRKKCNPRLAGGAEAVKLLLKRRGLAILLLLVAWVHQTQAPPREYDPWDAYIRHYQESYAGPITPDTITQLNQALEVSPNPANDVGIQTILDAATTAPEGSWILPTAPYEAIWSNNLKNYHHSTALTALLFLVLILAPIASQERQCGMTLLLRSTGGRSRVWLKKQGLMVLVAVLVWGLIYGMEVYRTVQTYGSFTCLAAPAYSLPLFRDRGIGISLGWTLVLYYGWKLAVMLLAGEICSLLSAHCDKNRDAVLVCSGVVLLPAALAVIGSRAGELTSLLLPLSCTQWLR